MKANISRRSFIAGAAGTCAALSAVGLSGCDSGTEEVSAETSGTTYRIATYDIYTQLEPFAYTNDDGNFVGIDADVLAAAMGSAGLGYEQNPIGWTEALNELKNGEVDGVILAGLAINEENEEKYDFSDPYFTNCVCAAAAEDDDIASFEDARGMTVAVMADTWAASWAESIADEYGFTLTYYDRRDTLHDAVILGDAALCFDDYAVTAYTILLGDPLTIVATEEEEYATPYGFAVLKGKNTVLLEGFNTGLAELQASGEYDEICNSYLA